MENKLFDTPEKIEAGLSAFKNLLDHAGWKLFVEIVNANIEVVKNQILKNPEGLDEIQMGRLRDRLSIMEEMRDTPDTNIKRLTTQDPEDPETDPFDTVDTITPRSMDNKA
jgi:hypothetical protein